MADAKSTTVSGVEYRDVPGYPGYRVGSDGSVWSCVDPHAKAVNGRRPLGSEWKQLTLNRHEDGHLLTSLRGRSFLVHRLVLSAFVGPCPEGMQCCHNDGNPANNRLSNLRWDTHAANMADKVNHGNSLQGERHNCAKLTEEQVLDIRSRPATQLTAALGREFGVSNTTVRLIRQGRIWRHLPVKVGSQSVRSRGPSHSRTKLTEREVLAIRAEYADGGITFERIGEKYKVTGALIRQIVRRKIWKHVA